MDISPANSTAIELQQTFQTPPRYFPNERNKDIDHRLIAYAQYVQDIDQNGFISPDLSAYRDYLTDRGLKYSSVKAHLSTVRKGLVRVARNRDWLYQQVASTAPADMTMNDLKPKVDEIVVRIHNATHPDESRVKIKKIQDRDDTEYMRLTHDQANTLLAAPDRDTLAGLRDAAIISLALATGLRAAELVALEVDDLHGLLGDEAAVIVREGKGCKQRLVPYGELVGALDVVKQWMMRAGITEGPVFLGVNNKGDVLDKAISTRTYERRLKRYPVADRRLTTHDLRRTYAKQRYVEGMDILAIRDNLGHADVKTTQGYIGTLDVSARVPAGGLRFV